MVNNNSNWLGRKLVTSINQCYGSGSVSFYADGSGSVLIKNLPKILEERSYTKVDYFFCHKYIKIIIKKLCNLVSLLTRYHNKTLCFSGLNRKYISNYNFKELLYQRTFFLRGFCYSKQQKRTIWLLSRICDKMKVTFFYNISS